MKILFCGSMVPEQVEYQVKDISGAGNRFQNNMINNLREAGHEVIECSFLGMKIPAETAKLLRGNYVIKKNGNMLKSIRAFEMLLKEAMGDTSVVICYNITYAWLTLPFLAKKRGKKSIVILADYSEEESYTSAAKKLYAKLQRFSMRRFDLVVGLSGNIQGMLKKRQKFLLMEGGIDRKLYDSFSSYKPHAEGQPLTLMYSGLLNHVTGVDLLLEAMKQVKRRDIRLIISGRGELEKEIQAAAETDDRIRFLGYLAYDEYVRQLQDADILLNPRNMELPENRNNFPSKILDYLATGKPVISTRFAGWEKFEEAIFFCGSSAEELGNCMENAEDRIADSETVFSCNRKRAAWFIWDEQLKRILEEIQ